nr:hypothetical protein [Burkholderia multivorans]
MEKLNELLRDYAQSIRRDDGTAFIHADAIREYFRARPSANETGAEGAPIVQAGRDVLVTHVPSRIYLNLGDINELGEIPFQQLTGVTWCEDRVDDTDIEYVRAPAQADAREGLTDERRNGTEAEVAQWQSRLKDRSSPVVDHWVNISPDGAKTLMEKYADVYEVRALYAAPQPPAQAAKRVDAKARMDWAESILKNLPETEPTYSIIKLLNDYDQDERDEILQSIRAYADCRATQALFTQYSAAQADAREGLTDEQIDEIARPFAGLGGIEDYRAFARALLAAHPGQLVADDAAVRGGERAKRKAFTAVFLDVTTDEASEIVNHPKWSAGSWSHALDDRDAARAELARATSSQAHPGQPEPRTEVTDDDKVCAERYRWLRARMAFVEGPNAPASMSMRSSIPAPNHDFNADFVGDRFDASVDAAIDGAIAAARAQGGEKS